MFNRFSPAARRVLRVAEQECRNSSHYYVGAEHLLLALCEEQDPAIAGWLAERRISAGKARQSVRDVLGTGEDRTWDGIIVTPRVRAIVALAEAAAGPGKAVEPVHLLDAILAERRSLAAEILNRVGTFTPPSPVAG